jgi:proteasome assembly chaperone (PAC2) family protein
MPHLRWAAEPPALDEPVLIAGFEGWNDAGDAASTAVRWLRERWAPEPLATIDGEEFYDFTATRPMVRLEDDRTRVIDWPDLELTWGRDAGRDVITLVGNEPHLKWRTFCEQVLGVAKEMDVRFVLTLGALLSDVPHTKPTHTFGTATDQALIDRLGLQRSGYEGPTGIVGVLHDACSRDGLDSASLWAPVSAYVPGAPSPKATLALVRRAASVLDLGLVTTDLEIASAAYERQVSAVVENDEDMAEYVSELERHYEQERDVPSGDELVAEVERFLREQ